MLATKTWEQFGRDNCSQMAAAITYYVLFALVPLTIFLVSVASVALPKNARANATEWVEDYLNVTPDDVTIALDDGASSSIETRYGPDAVIEIEQELVSSTRPMIAGTRSWPSPRGSILASLSGSQGTSWRQTR